MRFQDPPWGGFDQDYEARQMMLPKRYAALLACTCMACVGGIVWHLHKDRATAQARQKRAVQGDATAQYDLGLMYRLGRGVPRDDAMAVRWYRKAAEQGHRGAENNLAFMYHQGLGVSQNLDEALLWYRKAADQGNVLAQRSLANIYRIGVEVPHDYAGAVRWYRRAADQGDAYSQTRLGTMYCSGQGVPQNYAEAAQWLSKAAARGDADAQYALGSMYREGQGLPQDHAEAIRWYRKAAAQGQANARYALKSMGAETNTWRQIRYVYLTLAFLGGLLLSSQYVSRVKNIHGWPRKAEALLGALGMIYAGVSLYGIDHMITNCPACLTSAKNLLGGLVIGMFVTLCLAGWLTGTFGRYGDIHDKGLSRENRTLPALERAP